MNPLTSKKTDVKFEKGKKLQIHKGSKKVTFFINIFHFIRHRIQLKEETTYAAEKTVCKTMYH